MLTHQRIYSLDLLKTLGTVIIVFHHYQQYMEVTFASGINFFAGAFPFQYTVELFFLLSGFFAWHYIRRIQNGLPFLDFFGRTWLRFAPFLIIGAFGSGLLHLVYQKLFHELFLNTSVSLWSILKAALGIHDGWMFLPRQPINGHTWYVSILFLCYIILWLLVKLSQRRDLALLPLFAVMIVLGIIFWERGGSLPFLCQSDARGYISFFFGLLFASCLERESPGRKDISLAFVIILILTILFIFKPVYVEDGLSYLLIFLYYPCLIIILLSAPVRKLFDHSWIGTLSAVAFNTYMWHGSILLALRILTNLHPQFLALQSRVTMYAVTAVCFLYGTVSHYILEKPYNNYLSARLPEKNPKVK